jgi:hypothetical protein
VASPCPDCDAPLATDDDTRRSMPVAERAAICWRLGGRCVREPVDWRARALAAEAKLEQETRFHDSTRRGAEWWRKRSDDVEASLTRRGHILAAAADLIDEAARSERRRLQKDRQEWIDLCRTITDEKAQITAVTEAACQMMASVRDELVDISTRRQEEDIRPQAIEVWRRLSAFLTAPGGGVPGLPAQVSARDLDACAERIAELLRKVEELASGRDVIEAQLRTALAQCADHVATMQLQGGRISELLAENAALRRQRDHVIDVMNRHAPECDRVLDIEIDGRAEALVDVARLTEERDAWWQAAEREKVRVRGDAHAEGLRIVRSMVATLAPGKVLPERVEQMLAAIDWALGADAAKESP